MIEGVDDASPQAEPAAPIPPFDATAPAATPPPEPKPNPWQRMVGVFLAPVETLRDIARRPDIAVPLLVVIILSLICSAIIIGHIDFTSEIRQGMTRSERKLTPEQEERAVSWGIAIGKAAAWASPILVPFWWAIYAGVVLLCFRLFGNDLTYQQAYSVKIYSVFPGVIRGVLLAIIAATRGMIAPREMVTIVRSNPAFLTDPLAHPVLFALLGSLDVFVLWSLVLSVIGYAFAANVSRTRAAAIVVSLFVIGVLFSVGGAALGAGMRR